jgi:signal transduction histidine kinase
MLNTRVALPRLSRFGALFLIVAGTIIIAGWQFRIPWMRGHAFGTFVAPMSALCFLCSGISVLLQLSSGRKRQYFGSALAAFVTLVAVAVSIEYLFRVDLRIDGLFMAHRLSDWTLPLPGRFAVNTAAGFMLGGIGLLTLRKKAGWPWPEILGLLVALVAYLSVLGYLLGASVLYDRVMALHTAILFGVLGVVIACAASRHVLLGVVLSPFAGAIAARKMILAVITVLPLIGVLEVWAELAGIVSMRLGTALSVLLSVVVFGIFALRTAAVLNDTDEKRLETERALLRSSQIATAGRMAASIAHEVNNPLEAVTNLIYLLKSDDVSSETRLQYLEIAEKELNRVSAIARRTLGFYREDAQEVDIDLRDLIDGVLAVYRNKIAEAITVTTTYSEKPFIRAKAGEVRQILMNLFANAIDAVPDDNGTLFITVTSQPGTTSIEIKDNGHGIPKENLARVFEPFFTTKKEFGTGLGLWVTKELVVKNNGSIRVLSSTDAGEHGTVFELTFPSSAPESLPTNIRAERVGR